MNENLKTQWRVQVRKSRAHKWVNKGLFETRSVARIHAAWLRRDAEWLSAKAPAPGYGFGNTRVVKYVRAGK